MPSGRNSGKLSNRNRCNKRREHLQRCSRLRLRLPDKLEFVDLVLEIIGGFEAEQPKGVGEPCSPR